MTLSPEFRAPTDQERALLNRLLDAEFPGRDEIRRVLANVHVRKLDDVGGLALRCESSEVAPVVKRIPVEGEAADSDGVTIHVLLHAPDGRPNELEIYKDDGSPVEDLPPAHHFELIVLPPMPGETA